MRPLPFAVHRHPRALAKIHLRFATRLHFHPHEGNRLGLAQLPHEPFDGLITATEPVLANQVLINALRTQPDRHRRFNLGQPRLAKTRPTPAAEPRVEMAGFAAGSDAEPGVEMAGFDRASRRYLPTVSRLMVSSRAIRRGDQPCAAKVKIECCKLTLSWFIASLCRLHGSRRNASLKVAGFHSTLPGWF